MKLECVTTIVLCGLWAGLSGCKSHPARFYALAATCAQTQSALTVSVAVGPVSIPSAVDNPRIVLSVAQNELKPDEYNRWAAPLQEEIARTVAANLVMLLGTDRVTLATNTSGPIPDYRSSIEVDRFESMLGQQVTIEAAWTLRRTADGAVHTGRTIARGNVAGNEFRALAAAHSRALEQVSEDIARAVRDFDLSNSETEKTRPAQPTKDP
ncbi:MAG TPA: PqiC family protein [Steroidobacteraceae bacterium]|jgi:uncharacterized lipoprotein YmbA|nr:PqiC family protein [Steroidobacteraceae bacterium]